MPEKGNIMGCQMTQSYRWPGYRLTFDVRGDDHRIIGLLARTPHSPLGAFQLAGQTNLPIPSCRSQDTKCKL